MKNIKFPVFLTTAVLVLYTVVSVVWPDPVFVIGVFMFSPFLVIWMAYRVLKYGVPSGRTFDEYFYDDVDIHRMPIKEESDLQGEND